MTSEERSEKAKKILWTAAAFIFIILVLMGKRKLTNTQKECVWLGLIIYCFAVFGWMDYNVVILGQITNLMPYWLSLATIYIALAFIVAWHSFMETESVRNAARHGLTVFLFLVGAFADWFFFLWAGYVNDLNIQWWWMWQSMVFDYWTGWLQIGWSLLMVAVTFVVWVGLRD